MKFYRHESCLSWAQNNLRQFLCCWDYGQIKKVESYFWMFNLFMIIKCCTIYWGKYVIKSHKLYHHKFYSWWFHYWSQNELNAILLQRIFSYVFLPIMFKLAFKSSFLYKFQHVSWVSLTLAWIFPAFSHCWLVWLVDDFDCFSLLFIPSIWVEIFEEGNAMRAVIY